MGRRLRLRWALLGAAALFGTLTPGRAASQLISPGKLSSVHADLEGIRNCTQCHELHKPGISAERCLSCHEPLAARIRTKKGFHGLLPDPDQCATCHKEHFGADFSLVRLDTLRFNHRRIGFPLEGRHADRGCRDCHKPELITSQAVRAFKAKHAALDRTFLGLPTKCASCHEGDSPHRTQFEGRPCTDCHDVQGWKGARGFDHARARFHLTGRHRDVACAKCHATTPRGGSSDVPFVRYRPLTFGRCDNCHEDPHHGTMQGRCSSCHDTGGWGNVNRARVAASFDHGTTGFALEGSHARAECSSCHDARAAGRLDGVHIRFERGTESHPFPRPESGRCLSCHEDPHAGVFAAEPDSGDCGGCHGQVAWTPARFDAARHNRATSFELTGAHLTVACRDCHTAKPDGSPTFRLKASTCGSCHQETNPHGDQFEGRDCDACHTVETFHITHFDHDATRFPLRGAHAGAACSACHEKETDTAGVTMVRYRPLGTECRDCHGGTS